MSQFNLNSTIDNLQKQTAPERLFEHREQLSWNVYKKVGTKLVPIKVSEIVFRATIGATRFHGTADKIGEKFTSSSIQLYGTVCATDANDKPLLDEDGNWIIDEQEACKGQLFINVDKGPRVQHMVATRYTDAVLPSFRPGDFCPSDSYQANWVDRTTNKPVTATRTRVDDSPVGLNGLLEALDKAINLHGKNNMKTMSDGMVEWWNLVPHQDTFDEAGNRVPFKANTNNAFAGKVAEAENAPADGKPEDIVTDEEAKALTEKMKDRVKGK